MNVKPADHRIDGIFERYNRPGSPGCALAVMKDGEIVYQQGYGLAVLEHVGPTNVHTMVEDLAKWDENFYTGLVGGPAVLTRMVQPGRLNNGSELGYAFGLEVGPTHQHRSWQIVEHGGEHGSHCSWMLRFPELHLSVVVLFNHFLWEMKEYALKVADVFLEEIAAPPNKVKQQTAPEETATPIKLSAEQLSEKAGAYFNARRAALRKITCAEGKLQFQGLDLGQA